MRPTPFFAAVALLTLSANRTAPRWQAHGNVALDRTFGCAKAAIWSFGRVSEEKGEEPEAGSRRLYLWKKSAGEIPSAVIYMDGDRSFTAAWMDAATGSLGDTIWRKVRRQCRLA